MFFHSLLKLLTLSSIATLNTLSFPLHIFIQYLILFFCNIAKITNVIIFLCKLYWQIMTSIKSTGKHEKKIMIWLNNHSEWVSSLCLNQRFLLVLTESSMTVFLSINTISPIYWQIFFAEWGLQDSSTSSQAHCCDSSYLLSSEWELKKIIGNKLWKGNQKKISTIIINLYCVKFTKH